jgi:hypothetical protein
MISSNLIFVAVSAALRSSISVFDPALIPLSPKLASLKVIQRIQEENIPENDSSVDQCWQNF